jgi:hypothetical protein
MIRTAISAVVGLLILSGIHIAVTASFVAPRDRRPRQEALKPEPEGEWYRRKYAQVALG